MGTASPEPRSSTSSVRSTGWRNLPLEGRRPRRGRTAVPYRCLLAEPRRPAQASRSSRTSTSTKLSGATGVAWTPPIGTMATGVPPQPTTLPNSSTALGRRRGAVPRSARQPWPTADSTSSFTCPTPTATVPACAGSCATSSRSTAGTRGTPTCSARLSTGGSVRTRHLDGRQGGRRCWLIKTCDVRGSWYGSSSITPSRDPRSHRCGHRHREGAV